MNRQGSSIMTDEYTALLSGAGENLGITGSLQSGLARGLKIDLRHPPKHTGYDVLVEICVGLKPNLHDWGVKTSSRARRRFSYQSECASRDACCSFSNSASPNAIY